MGRALPKFWILALAGAVLLSPGQAASDPAAAGAASAKDERKTTLDAVVRKAIGGAALRGASIAVYAAELDTGKVLVAHGERVLHNPASNAKLYTAAATLALLSPEFRFDTVLVGVARGGVVTGPLTLRGYGDPSLGTAELTALALELKAQGIRQVDGDVLVDHRFFDDETTPPAYEQQPDEWAYFRAPVSAVAVQENCVVMTARPGMRGGSATISFEPPGFVDVDGTVTTGGEGADNVRLTLVPRGQRLLARVSGTISEQSRLVRYTRRVDDPRLLAGFALKSILERLDIKVSGEVKTGHGEGRVLSKHVSAPLSTLLLRVGKNSDNFYAEMLWKAMGAERKGRPAKSSDGAEEATRYLERIGALDQGMVLRNGSGLFDANRVTAWSVVSLLRHVAQDPKIGPEFLSQLAVGGVDGTLEGRFRSAPARRHVRAKTGTLEGTVSLSGYVLGPNGKGSVAFSILMNKVSGKRDAARVAADRIVTAIAKHVHEPR